MTTVFAAAAEIFGPIETPRELSEILTDFEADFQKQGIQTRRAAYELVK